MMSRPCPFSKRTPAGFTRLGVLATIVAALAVTAILYQITAGERADMRQATCQSNFKGVAFAPVSETPLPAAWTFMLIGVTGFGVAMRRRRAFHSAAA